MKRYALILAAGKGTRMKTSIPKCAYPILKKPMIEYPLEALERIQVDQTFVIVGYQKEVFYDLLKSRVSFVTQDEQLGTGHAVLQAYDAMKDLEGVTLIMPGDMPMVPSNVMDKLYRAHEEMGNDLTVVTMFPNDVKGYGRIDRDEYGHITGIVEEKDASNIQKEIKEVNSGTYLINNQLLFKLIKDIKKSRVSGEYYLTDLVKLMHKDYKVGTFKSRSYDMFMGINTLYHVSLAERYLRDLINQNMMELGVYMVNPDTITIGHSVIIEEGVTIYPNTTITGHTVIKKGAILGPNTELHDAYIDESARVNHSLVYNSTIGKRTTVGPFAHIRDQAVIGDDNRIGNFVEIKKSTTGHDTKASHLAYIGDSEVGTFVNFGCGAITVNYDGQHKHPTKIGDHVFIGCNVNLIAPIEIGSGAMIAAGSTLTQNVPEDALAIAREKQTNKEGYAKKYQK